MNKKTTISAIRKIIEIFKTSEGEIRPHFSLNRLYNNNIAMIFLHKIIVITIHQ